MSRIVEWKRITFHMHSGKSISILGEHVPAVMIPGTKAEHVIQGVIATPLLLNKELRIDMLCVEAIEIQEEPSVVYNVAEFPDAESH